jgi:hypothetical protein
MKFTAFHWQASLLCLTLNLLTQNATTRPAKAEVADPESAQPFAQTAPKRTIQSTAKQDLAAVPLTALARSRPIVSPEITTVSPESIFIAQQPNPATVNTITAKAITAAHPVPTLKILTPIADTLLDVPAATVVIQFVQGQAIELLVNHVAASPQLVGRTETDANTGLVTQTWYGVPLREADNTITLRSSTDPNLSTSIALQVRGEAKSITVETREAKIPADGRSIATITGQLLDGQKNRSNRDDLVTLTATAGEFVGEDAEPAQPGFQVRAQQGQFTAQLKAGLEAKTVRIRAFATNLEAFTQVTFDTDLRPSIATGVIDLRWGKRGTDFYRSLREFLPADGDNGYRLDGNVSLFTTGKIGEWLITGAYNNARNLNQDCNGDTRLFRDQQFCEHNYPIYGDSSQSTVVAPSKDSLYLKLERTSYLANAGSDFAMWGDFNTEEFATKSQEFTATTRQLHGFKGNYNLGNLQLSALYGNNIQGYQRDIIPPDGTSGSYFLSRRILVAGSEDVYLETEALNRPGTIVDRQQLNRGPDYEIDYDRGSLLFRQPVLRTDIDKNGETLVRRIVVSYQYDNPGVDANLYAGRLRYHLSRIANQESWIGATYLKENQGDRGFTIYGADAYLTLGEKANLIAEYAHSDNNFSASSVIGAAYRVDLQGELAKGLQTRAYFRTAEAGFANNATTSFIPGQTRYGAQATATLSANTSLRAQYDRERNQGIAPTPVGTFADLFTPSRFNRPGTAVDNDLTTISLGIQQKFGTADASMDWLHRDRTDRLGLLNSNSDQLRSRLSLPLAQNLTFLAQNETTLSSQTDAINGDRTLLGLNWQAIPGINLQLAQQFFHRGQFAGKSITTFSVDGDRKIGPDTTVKGRYSLFTGANDITMQGAIGLNHKLQISPGLRMDLAYERVFSTIDTKAAAGNLFAQPFAFGASSAGLGLVSGDNYSVGLEYSENKDFQASGRYERRVSTAGNNTVLSAAATGRLSPAITALFRYQQSNVANQTVSGLGDTGNLKVGLAYRSPDDDRFNALLRYEYRKNPALSPDTILLGSGTGSRDHLFGIEAIYAPDWQWEFYGKLALRSSTSYFANDLIGKSSVTLAQARATYRLDDAWDLTGEARWLNQSSANTREFGLSLEAGYYLAPSLRIAAGYSFGKVSDREFDTSRSAGGAYLGLTFKLNELFDGFGLQRSTPKIPKSPIPAAIVTPEPAAIPKTLVPETLVPETLVPEASVTETPIISAPVTEMPIGAPITVPIAVPKSKVMPMPAIVPQRY